MQKAFLVVGRAGLDLYAQPVSTRIENANSFSAQLGGSAGNIAVGLAKQGCKVSLLAAISDDPIGKFTRKTLTKYGVDTSFLQTIQNKKNTLAVVDTNGNQTQAVIYRELAADLFLSESLTQEINLKNFSTIIITGTSLTQNPSRKTVLSLMRKASQEKKKIILDIDYREGTWASSEEAYEVLAMAEGYSDILVGNEIEFDFMAGGIKGSGVEFARKINKVKLKEVIYKMGERGCILFSGGKQKRFNSYRVNALKPTGAGDAFLAGFCSRYTDDGTQNEAILTGAAAAAIVVSSIGCSEPMPTKKELAKFINDTELSVQEV